MKAIFRLPFDEKFILIHHHEAARNVASFFPFTKGKTIHLQADHLEICTSEELKSSFFEVENFLENNAEMNIPQHEEYLQKLEKAIEIIKQNNLPKLVISRPIAREISSINLEKTYQLLCKKYPNTLCYILISDEEIWIGATPEILGKFNKKTHELFTMSLAGTLPVDEEWSEKEIEEQKPVTHYISEILKKYSSEITQSETYNHISGNIKHLRTDFTAKIEDKRLEELIEELHPTPAVCGIPKEFCKEKIIEIEQYNREFYAGYIKIETDEEIYYFVNLRCAKIYKNQVIAFAGGGITALSSPEKEWRETELKSQAILHHLQ
ncbi:chorismate-binding protein [Cloacibacterium sp. TD35]|uniref:chorismate-binding protein n=1 Tax=Cloacibacterium sp. TD35 TaxID=2976818 RepID=UPI00237E7027|nr:chorismate-binding protein [Cloacibacterium sp. TD35]WDT67837.1 chorismate-binding protein [Cloacibacterium sp. TD35]